MLEAAILVIFPFCMAFAAISDMMSMTIANRVSLLLVVGFAVIAPFTGMEWSTYAWHFAAAALVFCVTFALFAVGGMGGGDAKLLTATALWLGYNLLLVQYLVVGAFLGGVLTVAILSFRRSPIAVYTANNPFLKNFADPKVGVPYGIALGVAGIMVFPQTALMTWALDRLAGH